MVPKETLIYVAGVCGTYPCSALQLVSNLLASFNLEFKTPLKVWHLLSPYPQHRTSWDLSWFWIAWKWEV